jgi:hypothetical protein
MDKNYNVNNPKIVDWIFPIGGTINYIKRNKKEDTNNSNGYANGLAHLALVNFYEIIALGYFLKEGLEQLIK